MERRLRDYIMEQETITAAENFYTQGNLATLNSVNYDFISKNKKAPGPLGKSCLKFSP